MAERKSNAAFAEPMLLVKTEQLPDGEDWLYEVKFIVVIYNLRTLGHLSDNRSAHTIRADVTIYKLG